MCERVSQSSLIAYSQQNANPDLVYSWFSPDVYNSTEFKEKRIGAFCYIYVLYNRVK